MSLRSNSCECNYFEAEALILSGPSRRTNGRCRKRAPGSFGLSSLTAAPYHRPVKLDQPTTLLITCARGLVESLEREVRDLGYTPDAVQKTSLTLTGTMLDAMKLNLHLRTAFGVLMLLREFRCRDGEALYRETRKIAWDEIIDPDEYLTVTSKVDTPSVNNSMFPSLKVKDAIVDRIAEVRRRRPDSGPDRKGVVVALYWRDQSARLYLDTSGVKLADRGYRRIPHVAPMQETLAAAVVLATGYVGTTPFVNPMCGSGTLAIEAALIAARRAPGLLRLNFALTHLTGHDDDAWKAVRREAQKQSKSAPRPRPIIATDIDDRAIDAAQRNARTAGVDHLIEFRVCDFAATPIPDAAEGGVVMLNPEYGLRLGEQSKLETTYARIGDFFKQSCAGYTGYVFTGNLELAKRVGLKASRRFPFFNADIECRLLKYELYAGTRRTDAAESHTES